MKDQRIVHDISYFGKPQTHTGASACTMGRIYDLPSSLSITDLMSGKESGRNAHSSGRVCGDVGHGELMSNTPY